jgi:hypothetical protein
MHCGEILFERWISKPQLDCRETAVFEELLGFMSKIETESRIPNPESRMLRPLLL